jgi:hypothetical protein
MDPDRVVRWTDPCFDARTLPEMEDIGLDGMKKTFLSRVDEDPIKAPISVATQVVNLAEEVPARLPIDARRLFPFSRGRSLGTSLFFSFSAIRFISRPETMSAQNSWQGFMRKRLTSINPERAERIFM